MKKYGKKLLALALSMTIVLSMSACGGGNNAEAPKEDAKQESVTGYCDTITWGQGADVTSLDPHQGKETPAVTVTCQIFDTLTVVDPESGELKPQIAESWEQIDDVTYRFKIRQDVKFHDGSALTVEDVKFSLDRAIASASVSYIVDFIKEVKVVDDTTVEVILHAPYAPALRNLAVPFAAIVPKAIVEKDEDAFILNPVGSGPYKFVEWKQGDSIKLKAFDEYMDGKPETQNLIMKVVPETAQRLIALETGDIDIAYDLSPNDVQKAIDNDTIEVLEGPGLSCSYITFNMNKAPFDNPKVREAINYAIDRQLIVDSIMSGRAEVADDLIAPGVFGYYGSGVYEHNVEKAKVLLKEAGYENGFTTSLMTNDGQARIDLCTAVQAMLSEVGITCNIDVMEFGAYIQKATNGEHEMALCGWVTSTKDADYTYYSLEHSSKQGASGNRSFIHDPEIDKLVQDGRTVSDPEKRKEIYKELSIKLKEINNNAPIYYNKINVGTNNKVEGFILDPIGYHPLDHVKMAK